MKSVCEDSGEDSSNLLRSILGVSPVPDQGAKQGPRTPKETKQGARSTKEANQEVRSPKVPLRRRMNSKSQEMPAVCSLSLQVREVVVESLVVLVVVESLVGDCGICGQFCVWNLWSTDT